ncbi:hypothetical protein SCYAM73S_04215 [Streptomyces cyaneofuscatus]
MWPPPPLPGGSKCSAAHIPVYDGADDAVARVLASGVTEVARRTPTGPGPWHDLGVTGYLCIPLLDRDRAFGAVTLLSTGGYTFDGHTVALAQEPPDARLAPEAVWRQRVSEVLADSAQLSAFAAAFSTTARKEGQPTHLHFHVARILQGSVGIPETGGMYRVAIEDVSAWTMGDFSYSDH